MYPVDHRLSLHFGFEGLGQFGQFGLGIDQVNLCQEVVGIEDFRHVGSELIAEHRQDADDFATLCRLQFAHLVISLHHFGRLDEHCLSRGRLVVYDTADLALYARGDGYHQSAVANGRRHVLVHQSVFLGSV